MALKNKVLRVHVFVWASVRACVCACERACVSGEREGGREREVGSERDRAEM